MSTPATVSATDPAATAPVVAAQPTTDAAVWQAKLDVLTKEVSDTKEQAAEATRTAQYWADKAKAGTPAAPVLEADDDTDVLETITTGGAKGFDALAAKRGFIKRDEVESLINQRAGSLTKEQELINQYPDLKKKDSPFFMATAGHYGELVKAGTPQAIAMELAAQRTELEFIRAGKMKLSAEVAKEEKEANRLARIAAQSGDGSGRRPAAAEDEDAPLTPEQQKIIAGFGITEEAYMKRAKTGVAMKGIR